MQRSFFERINQETAEAYARLEANPVLNALFQGKASLEDYRLILHRLYLFYSAWEFKFVEAGMGSMAGILFYTHLKTPLLEADLKVLDVHVQAGAFSTVAGLPAHPLEPAQALGAWFILEKATFSWNRLTKVLKRRYGLDSATGLAFFHNYGNHFEIFWDEFRDFVRSQVRYKTDEQEFIQYARQTLLALDSWLVSLFSDASPPALPAELSAPLLAARPAKSTPSSFLPPGSPIGSPSSH